MPGKAQLELKQTRPFASEAVEAYINLLRTADALSRPIDALLKPFDLSGQQYNVLRILRGAGPDGLPCGEIGERMITRDPDVTRLLDRLERRGLITRARDQRDRRVVTARITTDGLRILRELDRPVAEAHQKQLGHLGRRRLAALIRLLEQARAGPAGTG
jgi:DNA-binding MarR family transcriptional regulator